MSNFRILISGFLLLFVTSCGPTANEIREEIAKRDQKASLERLEREREFKIIIEEFKRERDAKDRRVAEEERRLNAELEAQRRRAQELEAQRRKELAARLEIERQKREAEARAAEDLRKAQERASVESTLVRQNTENFQNLKKLIMELDYKLLELGSEIDAFLSPNSAKNVEDVGATIVRLNNEINVLKQEIIEGSAPPEESMEKITAITEQAKKVQGQLGEIEQEQKRQVISLTPKSYGKGEDWDAFKEYDLKSIAPEIYNFYILKRRTIEGLAKDAARR
ncbi:hypothetical protein V5T82_16800 [Magnetovibrio sp. PR-2]|uniref:hypothetical protein n=1 Tax=Magnetovibrio sp. PR-2 TaxID=3120356 RepID=UPI002FCDF926